MKKLLSLLLALSLALSLTACGSKTDSTADAADDSQTQDNAPAEEPAGDPVELIVFAAASMTETMNQIKEMYEQENPNVTITYNFDSSGKLLTQITEAQRKCGLDAENTAGCEAVVQALGTPWERSVWLRNLLRKEQERLQHRSRSQTPDPIRRAQIFLEDNFTDHNLTLKAVADQVGLNEKYLSTQFTRRCGCTFISYLNNLRLRYA